MAARAARLLIFVVLALVASACGGSDADSDQTATDNTEVTDSSASSDGEADDEPVIEDPADVADDDDDDGIPAEADEPFFVPDAVQTRDCAHTLADLGLVDDEPVVEEVELPPAVKPEVTDDLFGEYDNLIVTDLIEGTGGEAVNGATIAMQYVGVLASDGTEFDSSWDRGAAPFTFELGQGRVINGWDEGILGMRVGGRRILQIPSAQAYGEQGSGAIITPNADLIFIVDMVDVSGPAEPAPPVPEDTLGSFGELVITDLVVGEGCEAMIGDIVAVHYVGVDAEDGAEFDSSWGRGETFRITTGKSQVIDGWNEGIAGMRVGGERILQIPADQAYGEADLVFRVHLEELVEAPFAHTVEFDGNAPDELQVTTLEEGTSDAAEEGNIIDAHVAVLIYNDSRLVQSTWEQDVTTQLVLTEGTALPGLVEGITGIKVGELRQIVIPASLAYPEGVPPNLDVDADDALVFIIQPVRVIEP